MRTRCKFRVVGIENVDHAIYQRIWKNDVSVDAYESVGGTEWTENYDEKRKGQQYRSKYLGTAQNIRLAAQYDPTIPEDTRFMEATPTGELKFYVSNPTVIGGFKIGENYYVDLTPCE